jgi:hypothetical protein
MKINIENYQVLSEDFTKHICVVVLNHYIELEKQIIDDNKDNGEVIIRSEKNLIFPKQISVHGQLHIEISCGN